MSHLNSFREAANGALAVAIVAHAAPQSETFRRKALDQATDALAEYCCQLLATHYKLDALPKKP